MKKKNNHVEFFAKLEANQEAGTDGFKRILIISEGPAKGHFGVEKNGKLYQYDPEDDSHAKLEKLPMWIAGQTLEEIVRCGNSRNEIKAKIDQRGDHAGGVTDTFGGYSNFRIENGSVYADLSFLPDTPHRSFVEGILNRMADEFGNSINFKMSFRPGKDASGQKIAIANCLQLASVDLVDSAAATNSLLEELDSPPPDSMPLSPEDLATIGKMITDAVAAATKADAAQDAATMEERLAKLEAAAATPDKKDDVKMSDDPDKKDEEKEKAEEAKLSSLALKIASEQFKKLSVGFVKTGENDGRKIGDELETAVQAQLSSGCKNRGLALQRIAMDNPKLYNEAAKNGKL